MKGGSMLILKKLLLSHQYKDTKLQTMRHIQMKWKSYRTEKISHKSMTTFKSGWLIMEDNCFENSQYVITPLDDFHDE